MYVFGVACCQQIHQSRIGHSIFSVICVHKEYASSTPCRLISKASYGIHSLRIKYFICFRWLTPKYLQQNQLLAVNHFSVVKFFLRVANFTDHDSIQPFNPSSATFVLLHLYVHANALCANTLISIPFHPSLSLCLSL